jgi:hypothetical protein
MIRPFSCIWRAGNVFTRPLNGCGQWSNKILLLRKKVKIFKIQPRALKSPYKIIQVQVQFLEHNIQVSVLPNTLSIILSNYCFNWRPGGILTLIFKKIGKIYLVMAQTFDLYANLNETWRTTFNRLEHSLKINRSYFELRLSSPQRNRISTIPPRKSKFWYFWVTLFCTQLRPRTGKSLVQYNNQAAIYVKHLFTYANIKMVFEKTYFLALLKNC